MRKHLVATLLAGTVLTTGALAYGTNQNGYDRENCNNKPNLEKSWRDCNHKKGKKMHKRAKMNHGNSFMMTFGKLNLTDEQKAKFKKIGQENLKNRPKMSNFFTNTGFDTVKYEKALQEKRENTIKNRAKTIEKMYATLTPKQKEQFKTLLELQEQRGIKNQKGW